MRVQSAAKWVNFLYMYVYVRKRLFAFICINAYFTLLLHIITQIWPKHALFSLCETFTKFPGKQTGFGYGKTTAKLTKLFHRFVYNYVH